MAFGLSAALASAVPVDTDHSCCADLLQAVQAGGFWVPVRMELLLRNSCNGISRQGPDGAGGCRREKRHTVGNGNCLAALPLVCYFFSKFIGMKKMWGERNEKELCYQGSLNRLELTKSKVY